MVEQGKDLPSWTGKNQLGRGVRVQFWVMGVNRLMAEKLSGIQGYWEEVETAKWQHQQPDFSSATRTFWDTGGNGKPLGRQGIIHAIGSLVWLILCSNVSQDGQAKPLWQVWCGVECALQTLPYPSGCHFGQIPHRYCTGLRKTTIMGMCQV